MHPASVIWTPTPLLTERSIINFLIWIGGLILGPYLAVSAVEYNFTPAIVFAVVCSMVAIFGFMRERMSMLPLIGLFIAGKFNFIPVLHPAPTELLPLVLILYYFIAYVALRRKKILTGPPYFYIPILILALIILYHEHSFGLRSTGNGREGGRGAVFVLVAAITYFCGVSIDSPSSKFLSRIPLFCIAGVIISAIPVIVTTYFPGTAPIIYIFTDNINGGAYTEAVANVADIVRNQGPATIGAAVATFLLAYFPIYTWWRPHRWWVAILVLVCFFAVVEGGFRSFLAVFGLTVFVAIWCYSSWRSLLLIPLLVVAVSAVIALQDSHVIDLPQSAQRSLAFLPGDWDPAVVSSTESSNDFRQRIQDIYIKEDAGKSPFLGNGLSYDSADFMKVHYLALTQETPDHYYSIQEFVMSKQFHTGWISLYDGVGLVGFAAFLVFTLSFIWVAGRMVFRKGVDRSSPLFPLKVWILCNTLPLLIGYFTVFGDFKTAFPTYCYFAILWVHLDRIEKQGYRASVPVREVPFDPSRTAVPYAV
jgi:hypothetical protein